MGSGGVRTRCGAAGDLRGRATPAVTPRILMVMAIMVRPPLEADLAALSQIDASYAEEHELEPLMSAGALRFFGRTEHSFVAHEGHRAGSVPVGFVLAQAIWSGERPQVLVARIASDGTPGASEALLKALVKSAYDSGVYDLQTRVPPGDAPLRALLKRESFFEDPQVAYVRILGSRGVAAAQRLAGVTGRD